jgi:DNA-binding transcriptional LysR family regulator
VDRIQDYEAFVATVEKGSLTAAANQLGRSLQSVSRSLAALEREVGVELIRRTTRRSNPTDAGQALFRRLSAALADIEAAKLEAANRRADASGLLRVTASSAFAPLYIVPYLPAFLAANPRVEIELDLTDAYVDLIGRSFDLAVRIGELPDSSLKSRLLATSRRVMFAAPSYLAAHGRPRRPDDLKDHQCIVRTAAREGNAWPFQIDGKAKSIRIGGRFRTSGALAANEAAVQGLGIANAPLWQVRALADAGKIELLLTRFEPPPVAIHAVWPATHVLPARTQLFIEYLAARLKKERL